MKIDAGHVVVGAAELVLALLMAQELQRPVGDDLVGVHVRGRARAALDHVHQEVLPHPSGLLEARQGYNYSIGNS